MVVDYRAAQHTRSMVSFTVVVVLDVFKLPVFSEVIAMNVHELRHEIRARD
jgi:hypothetical protein